MTCALPVHSDPFETEKRRCWSCNREDCLGEDLHTVNKFTGEVRDSNNRPLPFYDARIIQRNRLLLMVVLSLVLAALVTTGI